MKKCVYAKNGILKCLASLLQRSWKVLFMYDDKNCDECVRIHIRDFWGQGSFVKWSKQFHFGKALLRRVWQNYPVQFYGNLLNLSEYLNIIWAMKKRTKTCKTLFWWPFRHSYKHTWEDFCEAIVIFFTVLLDCWGKFFAI